MKQVTVYTRQFCGYCTRAKALLDNKGVAFDEKDATVNPEFRHEMLARANGRTTFPQIFIGETHVGGCDDLLAAEASGRLDTLLTEGEE